MAGCCAGMAAETGLTVAAQNEWTQVVLDSWVNYRRSGTLPAALNVDVGILDMWGGARSGLKI